MNIFRKFIRRPFKNFLLALEEICYCEIKRTSSIEQCTRGDKNAGAKLICILYCRRTRDRDGSSDARKILRTHIFISLPLVILAGTSWRRRLRLPRAQVFNTELYKDRTSTFNIVILLNLSYNMYTKLNPQTRGAHWSFAVFSPYFFFFFVKFLFFFTYLSFAR